MRKALKLFSCGPFPCCGFFLFPVEIMGGAFEVLSCLFREKSIMRNEKRIIFFINTSVTLDSNHMNTVTTLLRPKSGPIGSEKTWHVQMRKLLGGCFWASRAHQSHPLGRTVPHSQLSKLF